MNLRLYHVNVPMNTSAARMKASVPTANYPSVHAFTTSDPPYQNTTRYNPVCAPTQRNDHVHYQSPHNPAAPLTWGLSPSTYYQPLAITNCLAIKQFTQRQIQRIDLSM